MSNDPIPEKLPNPLREIHEIFSDLPHDILRDEISWLDEYFKSTKENYRHAVSRLAQELESTGGGGEQNAKAMKAVTSFFDETIKVIAKNQDSLPENFFDLIAERAQSAMGIIMEKEVSMVTADLDLSFWKSAHADTFMKRIIKQATYYRMKIATKLSRKKSGKEGSYGVQVYKPADLYLYYYARPVIEKLYELSGRYLQGHAKAFYELHIASESMLKKIIDSEISETDLPAGLISALKLTVAEQSQKEEILEKSDREQLFHALEEFQSIRLNLLTERSEIAGTFLLPSNNFDVQLTVEQMAHHRSEAEIRSGKWKDYFDAETDDWLKDIQVLRLAHLAMDIFMQARNQISERVESNVISAIQEAAGIIDESIQLITGRAETDEEGLKESILKESRSTFRKLRREKIPHITDQINQSSFPKVFSNINNQLKHRIGSLDEEFSIISQLGLETIPPSVKIQKISLKKIIQIEYYSPFVNHHEKLTESADNFLNQRLRTLSEIGQVIEYNLETALEILDSAEPGENSPDAQKVVEEGLERARVILEDTKRHFEKAPIEWGVSLKKMIIEMAGGMVSLSDNEEILNLQIREARAELRSKISGFRSRLFGHIRTFLKKAWQWTSFLITGARSGYRQISLLTGPASLSDREMKFMDLLYQTKNRIEKLPYIYQRLYRFEPLNDQVLFGGREKDLEEITEKYRSWKEGSFSNTVVIGEKGSGRTTLMNLVSKRIGTSNPVHRIRFTRQIVSTADLLDNFTGIPGAEALKTPEELIESMQRLDIPVICLVEDLQFLFTRTLDGFDLIEKFLWLISQTHRKVFWIVSIGSYSWNFLDVVLSVSRYFHHIVFLSQLEADQMKEIILKRHRISGYGLSFIPDESDLNDRKFKKLKNPEERQKYLEDQYFSELHSITRGNISVALLLWQLSVEKFEKDKVLLRNNLRFETNFLNDLPEEEIFTLEALLEHEYMTVEEHSKVFGEPLEISSRILIRMRNKGLLVETGGAYQIHYMIYKPVVRMLNKKNILK